VEFLSPPFFNRNRTSPLTDDPPCCIFSMDFIQAHICEDNNHTSTAMENQRGNPGSTNGNPVLQGQTSPNLLHELHDFYLQGMRRIFGGQKICSKVNVVERATAGKAISQVSDQDGKPNDKEMQDSTLLHFKVNK
jgi:hypothetical protein